MGTPFLQGRRSWDRPPPRPRLQGPPLRGRGSTWRGRGGHHSTQCPPVPTAAAGAGAGAGPGPGRRRAGGRPAGPGPRSRSPAGAARSGRLWGQAPARSRSGRRRGTRTGGGDAEGAAQPERRKQRGRRPARRRQPSPHRAPGSPLLADTRRSAARPGPHPPPPPRFRQPRDSDTAGRKSRLRGLAPGARDAGRGPGRRRAGAAPMRPSSALPA